MAYVRFTGLKKHFGQVRAVDGVDLEIGEGEFLVLLGPSGSGKTTLMRLCAGLDEPTAGSIFIDVAPRKRGIAMVFQSYALYPHKTVFKNISFPLSIEGLPRQEIRSKVEWAANLLGIGHLLERMPSRISGGERQRVAIARALVRRPRVLLMDEPLSNLDAKVRHTARDELKKFQREIGVTTIYVTHDQVEAMGLGDRIAVMNEGRIRQVGSPDEIYQGPADTFVAGFVGIPPMNFMEENGMLTAFRPETFLPAELISEQEQRTFLFRIERIEHLGSYNLVYGKVGDTLLIANLSLRQVVNEGTEVPFAVRLADIRYYDRTTGRRITP